MAVTVTSVVGIGRDLWLVDIRWNDSEEATYMCTQVLNQRVRPIHPLCDIAPSYQHLIQHNRRGKYKDSYPEELSW